MFDVAIIGCGPVGALAANLLGKAGLRTLVVEKEADPYPLPRAVHLDHEMLRFFQAADVIDDVIDDMCGTEGHLHVGADLGVIRYMGTVGKPRPFGWGNDYFFYQPELEEHLRGALSKYPNVELRLGTEFQSLSQADGQVTLELSDSSGTTREVARWAIACDGSKSAVRKSLAIPLDDLEFDEPWLVVDAEVDGPVKFPAISGVPEEANLQTLSVMMCNPRRPATIVPGRGNHRRWELMLLPGEDDQDMMRPGKVKELVGPWLEGVPHRIIRAATYHFHGLIAKQWRRGNVFLAGDAAHQTPPFFGQGMCHGLRDVANLAWKMALVSSGTAAPELLDTYQEERDPHVRAVISTAVETGRYICLLDEAKAAARDADIRQKARSGQLASTGGDIIPPINNGIVAPGSPGAGERFIQPSVTTEAGPRLLDDVVGDGWRLFVADARREQSALSALASLPDGLRMSVINAASLADEGAVSSWLARRHATSVLVRPDFYVYGSSDSRVSSLLRQLLGALGIENDLEVAQA